MDFCHIFHATICQYYLIITTEKNSTINTARVPSVNKYFEYIQFIVKFNKTTFNLSYF